VHRCPDPSLCRTTSDGREVCTRTDLPTIRQSALLALHSALGHSAPTKTHPEKPLRACLTCRCSTTASPGSGHLRPAQRQPLFAQRIRGHVPDRTRKTAMSPGDWYRANPRTIPLQPCEFGGLNQSLAYLIYRFLTTPERRPFLHRDRIRTGRGRTGGPWSSYPTVGRVSACRRRSHSASTASCSPDTRSRSRPPDHAGC
jgi:hypothetical protein